MKKYQKIICVAALVVLVVCSCCFSASAATIYRATSYNAVVASSVYNDDPYLANGTWYNATNNADGSHTFQVHSGRTGSYLNLVTPFGFRFSPTASENVYKWDKIDLDFYFASSAVKTRTVSLCLIGEGMEVVKKLVTVPYVTSGAFKVSIPAGSMSWIEEDGYYSDVYGVSILLQGDYAPSSPTYFVWQPYSINITRMSQQENVNGLLEDITADKYNPPAGQNQMDSLGKQEAIVNQSAQSGMNEASNIMKSFSLESFSSGLLGTVQLYNRIIPNMPWLNQLLTISLALGLFAFLVGMGQAIIGRLNANDRKAQREQGRRGK